MEWVDEKFFSCTNTDPNAWMSGPTYFPITGTNAWINKLTSFPLLTHAQIYTPSACPVHWDYSQSSYVQSERQNILSCLIRIVTLTRTMKQLQVCLMRTLGGKVGTSTGEAWASFGRERRSFKLRQMQLRQAQNMRKTIPRSYKDEQRPTSCVRIH